MLKSTLAPLAAPILQALPLPRHLLSVERLQDYALDAGINLAAATLLLLIGWSISSWLASLTKRVILRTRRIDDTLVPITVSLVRYGIIGATLIAVLNRFGVQTTSLIAVVGAAGLAVGLAIQGTLANVAAGAMLLFLRPFKAGDWIEAAGIGGTVREIGLYTTVLITADMLYISVPNSQIFGGTIVNLSREPTRRINFTVGIDYADDVDRAQTILLELLKAEPRVLRLPEPMVPVGALGASAVDLIVRCWTANADYWPLLYDLHKAVKLALDAGGITIAYPQHVVQFRGPPPSSGSSPAPMSRVPPL